MPEVTLAQLIGMFACKRVRITHSHPNKCSWTQEGICNTVYKDCEINNYFELEFDDGKRVGFRPEIITENSVEGAVRYLGNDSRKIELV